MSIHIVTPYKEWNISYTGNDQHFTIPVSGIYTFEVVGGGSIKSSGGYVKASFNMLKGQKLSLMVGQKGGTSNKSTYGFGGSGLSGSDSSGGGLSGVFLGDGAIKSNDSSRALIIAGGAGGGTGVSKGGNGGGEKGEDGENIGYGIAGSGGTQIGHGTDGNIGLSQFCGGDGTGSYGAGGGGGWWGGNGSIGEGVYDDDKGAGGGSGYVKEGGVNISQEVGKGAIYSHGSIKIYCFIGYKDATIINKNLIQSFYFGAPCTPHHYIYDFREGQLGFSFIKGSGYSGYTNNQGFYFKSSADRNYTLYNSSIFDGMKLSQIKIIGYKPSQNTALGICTDKDEGSNGTFIRYESDPKSISTSVGKGYIGFTDSNNNYIQQYVGNILGEINITFNFEKDKIYGLINNIEYNLNTNKAQEFIDAWYNGKLSILTDDWGTNVNSYVRGIEITTTCDEEPVSDRLICKWKLTHDYNDTTGIYNLDTHGTGLRFVEDSDGKWMQFDGTSYLSGDILPLDWLNESYEIGFEMKDATCSYDVDATAGILTFHSTNKIGISNYDNTLIWEGPRTDSTISGDNIIITGGYHLVKIIYTPNSKEFFIDGNLVWSETISGNLKGTDRGIMIGKDDYSSSGGQRYYKGKLRNVYIKKLL